MFPFSQRYLEAPVLVIFCRCQFNLFTYFSGIAILAVIQHGSQSISPGLVGLAISYALGITGKLSGLVSAFTETEREFVAVERCKQYLDDIKIEDFDGGVTTTPYNWPSEGILVFKDVSFRCVNDYFLWNENP